MDKKTIFIKRIPITLEVTDVSDKLKENRDAIDQDHPTANGNNRDDSPSLLNYTPYSAGIVPGGQDD